MIYCACYEKFQYQRVCIAIKNISNARKLSIMLAQRLQIATYATLLQRLLNLQSTHNAGTPMLQLPAGVADGVPSSCRRSVSAYHWEIRLHTSGICGLPLCSHSLQSGSCHGSWRDQVMMGQTPPRYPRQVNLNAVRLRSLWCCNGRWWVMRRHDCNVMRGRDRQYSFQSTTSVNSPINTTTYITSLANKPLYLL